MTWFNQPFINVYPVHTLLVSKIANGLNFQSNFHIIIYFLQGQPPQDSPKKTIDKGPAPNPPLSGEAQLKYENDRLKLALAQRYVFWI